MNMIHSIRVEGYTKATEWCGPSAVAALTGAPLREATEVLTRIHDKTYEELEGVYPETVMLALRECGYRCTDVGVVERYGDRMIEGPSLKRFLAERTPAQRVTPMLITLHKHFVVAHGDFLIDNWVKRPTPIAAFPKLMRRVKAACLVTKGL